MGADINAKNKDGWTSLHGAAQIGYLDAIEVLLREGAQVDVPNKNGWTALFNG